MDEIFENLLLKRIIEYNGSVDELKEKIRFKREKKFNFEWISNNEFKFSSKLSIGTIILDFNPKYFDGIKGYGELINLNNEKSKIVLKTKMRIELYIFAILSLLFPFIYVFSDEILPIWILFVLPFTLVWFWFVYRFQEKILFDKVENYIKTLEY